MDSLEHFSKWDTNWVQNHTKKFGGSSGPQFLFALHVFDIFWKKFCQIFVERVEIPVSCGKEEKINKIPLVVSVCKHCQNLFFYTRKILKNQ